MYRNNRMEKMAEIEKVIFMNMCMVYDDKGNVLVQDKITLGVYWHSIK